jgi:uncharacterized protein
MRGLNPRSSPTSGYFDSHFATPYHSPIMFRALQGWFEPHVLGEHKARLEGQIPISKLPRVRDLLASDKGSVRAGLSFDQLSDGTVLLDMSVTADVELTCQRCLEPFVHNLEVLAKLALMEVYLGSAPEGYEAYEFGRDRINPVNLIEDELIVTLPLVPRHPVRETCVASLVESQAFNFD